MSVKRPTVFIETVFPARVRAGYNECVKVRTESYINRDYFVFVNERMSGGAQLYLAIGVQ